MKSFLRVFTNRKMAVVFLTGFSSGLPLALTGGTLQAWMTSEKVDLTVIGIFSLVGLPYTLKYLWAPLMDRYVPPFLGRRRGWMILVQMALIFCIGGMAFSKPVLAPAWVATLAFGVAFFSSSQDIVVDAYRTELLDEKEMGAGAALYIMGYRIAMLVSGALALILSDRLPWKVVYLIMAAAMLVGVGASLFAPEPRVEVRPPRTLGEAVVQPFVEYFKRNGAFQVLVFIIFYKLGDVMAFAMTTPFMLNVGFTRTDIGVATKGLGMVATIAGGLIGGAWMAQLKIKKALWIFGLFQGVSTLSFMMLAHLGHNYPMMVAAIGLENLSSGMGNTAFAAYLMSLCDKRFTATQYALLTSLMAFTRVVVGAPTGFLAKNLGWESYFLVCTLAAAPGLFLLSRIVHWNDEKTA